MNYSREILLLLLLKNLMTNPYRRASIDPGLMPRIKTSGNERIPVILYHKDHSLSHMASRCKAEAPSTHNKGNSPGSARSISA